MTLETVRGFESLLFRQTMEGTAKWLATGLEHQGAARAAVVRFRYPPPITKYKEERMIFFSLGVILMTIAIGLYVGNTVTKI